VNQPYTKQEGYAHKAVELCEEYEIEANPISEPKWKLTLGLNRMPIVHGVSRLLACLIEYADEATGIAWPSETTIAKWAATPLKTIKRAVPLAAKLGLISIYRRQLRGLKRGNIYLLNWHPFVMAFNKPRPGQNKGGQSGPSGWGQIGPSVGDKVAHDYSYMIPLNKITVVQPSAGTPNPESNKKEGKQERVVNFNPSKRRDK
jgi:hypothetical protein